MSTDGITGDFQDKVVLVTGGSRGIGRATVLGFAQLGAQVAFCYHVNRTAAEEVCRDGEANRWSIWSLQADVGYREPAEFLVTEVLEKYGRIDILVNNAGLFLKNSVVNTGDEEWETVLRSNLYSAFYCSRAVLPSMIAAQQGSIVNIASIAGKRGSAYHAHYAAAKGGLMAFTRSLAREVIRENIYVNAVCPGRVRTEQLAGDFESEMGRWMNDTPIRRLAEPEEIAHAVLFLASQKASYIVGETFEVDGGLLMD